MTRAICLLTAFLLAASAAADDWPQFRGPNCSGVSRGDAPLPETLSPKDAAWAADLGDGIGSVVVASGRVFMSDMVDDKTVGLHAFDAASGRKLWSRKWPMGDVGDTHETNSHASTTPAADDKRVYFYFSTLGMLALDAKTGEDVWKCELPEPYFVFKWGAGMSPVLHDDKLIFCQDDDLNPALYAIGASDGKILWKDDRSDMAVNYSHPVICPTPRGQEIVVAGTGLLVGYDPQTGKRLWKARTLLRNIKTTPVVVADTIYISLQSSGIANQWLATADRSDTGNNDGKLSKAEMQAFVGKRKIPEEFYKRTFDRGDKNGDGQLEGAELDVAFLRSENFAGARFDRKEPADEFILAVRGGGRGDVTDKHVLWKHPTKHTDHIVSPLVLDGRMLLVKGGGIATCFETKGGQPLFGPARIKNGGEYFASPVSGDGKIYIAGENGKVVVLRAGDQLDAISVNDLGDSIVGTPAIADGALFVRTRSQLFCFRAK